MKRLGISAIAVLAALVLHSTIVLAQANRTAPHNFIREMTPAEMARDFYNQGIEAKNKAIKLEEKLANTSEGAQREKLEKKVWKSWKKAAHEFKQATEKAPDMFQGWGELGMALSRMGDDEGSLDACDRAIEIAPNYFDVVVTRAEIYLRTGRLDEAKEAYEDLSYRNDEFAAKLLASMKDWAGGEGARDADVETVAALQTWISEQ